MLGLAAHSANVDAKRNNGITPLAEAAEAGQLGLVMGLAAHDADLDAKNNNGIAQ